MTTIEFQNVNKVYGEDTVAVDDVSFAVNDGEFLVLVGPSGCGKTTTLELISGLQRPTSGTITIDGEVVNDVRPRDRGIAMVFQNYALYPHKTVRENIQFGLKYTTDLSKAERNKRAEETAEMLGIEKLLDQKPKKLSGGQQQRVALGRAIVRKPSVFLLDEPLSNLDAKLRTQMRAELQQLQTELDVTTVYVTHDQTEAMTMGDRIAVMSDGKLQQIGTPTEVYNEPANEFVANFIGSPSINFLPGTLDGTAVTTDLFTCQLRRELDTGDSVRVGIRPQDLFVTEDTQASPVIQSEVTVVEALGSENIVYLEGKNQPIVARVAEYIRPSVGDTLALSFDPSRLYVFDGDGRTIKDRDPSKREEVTFT